MTKRSALGSDRPGFESQLGNLLPVSLKPGFIVIKVGTVIERLAGPRALLFLKKKWLSPLAGCWHEARVPRTVALLLIGAP